MSGNLANRLSNDDHPERRTRRTDPETSRQAAFDNAPRAGSHKAQILRAMANDSGQDWTAHEVSDRVFGGRVYPNNSARRLKDLEDDGFVMRTGETRETPSGSQATLWRITWAGGQIVSEESSS